MYNKIIQLNINYYELLLLITNYNYQSGLRETLLKSNNTINIKNYLSYNYIKQHANRLCRGSSLIISHAVKSYKYKYASNFCISKPPENNINVFIIYSPK